MIALQKPSCRSTTGMNSQRGMTQGEPAIAVSLCHICNKPFTADTSYNRHVSYCRRAQSRQKVRRKSCRACKAAKAKCSFQPCCTRCASKGLDCAYDRTPVVGSVTPISNQRSPPSDSSTEPWNYDPASMFVEFDIPETFEPDFLGSEAIQELPSVSSSSVAGLIPFSNNPGPITLLDGVSILPATWDLSLDFSMNSLAARGHKNFEHPSYLTKISLSNAFAQHSADLIIEALYAIPEQMRRRETFPPFIHPHWHLKTLPEPLAICMQIAGMYFLKSPEIRGFVWRSILAEQRRAIQRLDKLSGQEILAETQVGMVYLMMRLADGVMRDLEWTREMMIIQTALCTRFLEMNDFSFCHSEETHPSLTWEDWIYAESRRRTSLVWFLITRTIVVTLKTNCPTVDTPETLPLSAPKTQWEARTREAWMEELWLEGPPMATLGDLIEVKKHVGDQRSTRTLGTWNARMDYLGSLLNIAVTLV